MALKTDIPATCTYGLKRHARLAWVLISGTTYVHLQLVTSVYECKNFQWNLKQLKEHSTKQGHKGRTSPPKKLRSTFA